MAMTQRSKPTPTDISQNKTINPALKFKSSGAELTRMNVVASTKPRKAGQNRIRSSRAVVMSGLSLLSNPPRSIKLVPNRYVTDVALGQGRIRLIHRFVIRRHHIRIRVRDPEAIFDFNPGRGQIKADRDVGIVVI